MSTHLSDAALMDVLDGTAAAPLDAHVAGCGLRRSAGGRPPGGACGPCRGPGLLLSSGRPSAATWGAGSWRKTRAPGRACFRRRPSRRRSSWRPFTGLLSRRLPDPETGGVPALPALVALAIGGRSRQGVLQALGSSAADLGPATESGGGECLGDLSEEESLALAEVMRNGNEGQGLVTRAGIAGLSLFLVSTAS
jgi:hypothetical protein